MGENTQNSRKNLKERFAEIRLRTWTLTISIIIAMIFYFLVTIVGKQSINPVDFVLLSTATILTHFIYFPDGKIFGMKSDEFIANHDAYNDKAGDINEKGQIGYLRVYCKVDYKKRIQRYIENECGAIGITLSELEWLKQNKTEYEIKKLEVFSYKPNEEKDFEKVVHIAKNKRKRLYNLIFGDLPIEENTAESIMSAVENNGYTAIHDESIAYEKHAHVRKIIISLVIGLIFAYVGYSLRDGLDLTVITSIVLFLTSLLATAVMAYSTGEITTKVYKSRYYLSLYNFIDEFNEWYNKNQDKTIEILDKELSI